MSCQFIVEHCVVGLHAQRPVRFSGRCCTRVGENGRRLASLLHTVSSGPSVSERLDTSFTCCSSATSTSAAVKDQSLPLPNPDVPTGFERLCSALMFVLPLSEGLYRLALVGVRFCKRHALEFLFWCHIQLRQVTLALSSRAATDYTREDVLALETLMQMSRRIHTWLSEWSDQLMNLAVPLRPGRGDLNFASWVSETFTSPEALWHLAWLSCMSVLAAIAGFTLERKKGAAKEKSEKIVSKSWRWFSKPEVISVSYFCAVLMRVSWAPMEGMSDLSLELYCLGATLLTVITTAVAVTQVHRLLFGDLAKVSQFLEGMVEQVTNIAQLHRSFLLLDWLLCLFSREILEVKCMRSLLLLVYWITVTALEGEAGQTPKPAR